MSRSAGALRLAAPAKINLTLEVLGRHSDGFHDLVSVVQTVDLLDAVTIEAAPGRSVRFVGEGGRPLAVPGVGPSQPELIARAWDLLIDRYGVDDRAAVRVEKRIPVAAGLGGGSSDAAAFLRLARRWWNLALDDAELAALAAEIGSDVTLFLNGGTVVMEGRGEKVRSLPEAPAADDWAAAVWSPELPLPQAKTATMFHALRPTNFAGGRASRALVARLESGRPPRADDVYNTFDAIADEVLLGLRPARRRFAAALGAVPLLAGAGPAFFALGDPERLASAVASLDGQGGRAWLVRPFARSAWAIQEVAPSSLGEG